MNNREDKHKLVEDLAHMSLQKMRQAQETSENSTENPLERMHMIFDLYDEGFCPTKNRGNLEKYVQSFDFQKHCKTSRVYYNEKELQPEDAKTIAWHREPVNIGMGQYYDKAKLKKQIGHSVSAFNDASLKKLNGTFFHERPNSICIYSETYLWPKPGKEGKKEIACLSIPAPALDIPSQPHWEYYMQDKKLDAEKYEKEMKFLAASIVRAFADHKNSAFDGKGIKRIILPRYGQGNFLNCLQPADKIQANQIFYKTLVDALIVNKEALSGVSLNMIDYSGLEEDAIRESFADPLSKEGLLADILSGDIIKIADDGDLIINAWDPHSIPGNGCDKDFSFDGAMGKGTGIPLVQLPWMNFYLVQLNRYYGLRAKD